WKINQFQLYIEHTFAWPSHPKIGKGYDPLTPGDIITIDKACAKRHINFVPNLQSFGHQHHMLQRKEYAPLAETDMRWTLSPAEPGTYTLLDELFAEFLPNFRSTVFNIDSDETYDLGKGKSASMVAEKGLGCVYLDHILKLRDMAARYGRQIMFWGDIILHHPELITSIPDDVTVLEWQYGEFPNEDHVRQFAEAGKKFYVCPGTNSWRAIFPRQQEARGNISRMAQYAIKYGAIGMLNTDWGDGGHFNLQGLSYYGYAFGAAESWNPGTTTDFDTAFGRLFFGPEDGAKVMEAMKHLETITRPTAETFIADIVMVHTGFLTGSSYREKLTPEVVAVMKSHAQQAFNLVKSLRGHTRHPLTISELYQAAYQDLLLAEKAEAAVNFHRQYAELQAHGDSEGLTQLAKDTRKVLKALVIKAEKVPDIFAPLWHARARLAGLSENIEYQMEVIEDLQASAEWISKAVKTAKKAGMLPALPAIDDHWEPKCMRAQVG
ncbi:MAG TPA: family 20 glycosylhydrolase, partial [Armatimonadota bacterium]|nr:family 20 glycosylhydrolase [Armatimonadota bacterium]